MMRETLISRKTPGNCGDLSSAAFSLTHSGCGPDDVDDVIELQLYERLLLAWCPLLAALETFGSLNLPEQENVAETFACSSVTFASDGHRNPCRKRPPPVCESVVYVVSTGEMVDRDGESKLNVGSQERIAQVPKVSDAFKRGIFISITTWSGREIIGAVCDREQTDLLLDVREPDADSDGYVFVPWSSVEQVKIRNVAQRRVKFLRSQPGITLPPV
jgi:hypothetical protein